MLLCTIAPKHQGVAAAGLAASLLQPRFQKVNHQRRDAGSLVHHEMTQPAVQLRGNPAVQHGDIGGRRLLAEGFPLLLVVPGFRPS